MRAVAHVDIIHVNNFNRESYLAQVEPCVIALGFFDGVHLGHQQVISTAKRVADEKELPLACMSFYPHPREIITNGKKKVQYIMPMADKQKMLKKMGVKKFYIIRFDPGFASLSPKEFVHSYLLDYGVKSVVAGFDFTYGYRGEGNMDRIIEDSEDRLEVIKVNEVTLDGEKVSSTLIRKLIQTGRVELIHRYLGKRYEIEGRMFSNEKTIEFKMNPHYILPASGVYEVIVANGLDTWKQEALVDQEEIQLINPSGNRKNLTGVQSVQVIWVKRLSSELNAHFVESQFLLEEVLVY